MSSGVGQAASPALSRRAGGLRPGVFTRLGHRIAARQAQGEVFKLHIGDCYAAPPPEVLGRFTEGIAPALCQYQPTKGMPGLVEAIAGQADGGIAGLGVTPAEIFIGTGATGVLSCVAAALFDPGDHVAVLSPYWPLIAGVFRAAGVEIVEVPVLAEAVAGDDAGLLARLAEALERVPCRGVYFSSPNNPSGYVLGRRALEGIAELAGRRGLWVIADEVYAPFTYLAPHVPMLALDDKGVRARTVTVRSFSKSHALAGLRCGFAVADAPVAAALNRVGTHHSFAASSLAQEAARVAMGAGAAWQGALRAEFAATAQAFSSRLNLAHASAQAGSYVFVSLGGAISRLGEDAVFEAFLEAGVVISPGASFGQDYADYARICFTSEPPEAVMRAAALINEAASACGIA